MAVDSCHVEPDPYKQSNNNCSLTDPALHTPPPPPGFGPSIKADDAVLGVNNFVSAQTEKGTSAAKSFAPSHTDHEQNRSVDKSIDGTRLRNTQRSLNSQSVFLGNEIVKLNGQSNCSPPMNTRHSTGVVEHRPKPQRSPSDLSNGSKVQVDDASAQRLAKRLFTLDGFRRSDVASHLTRDNLFSRKVNEEYLKYFDFYNQTLVEATRKFLQHFPLAGETQERERVLSHFTSRYLECNPSLLNTVYQSQDSCHTLTCAIMLLNTDRHGQNIGRKMTQSDFMENLSQLNEGQNFAKDLLKECYISVKQKPLVWAQDDIEEFELVDFPEEDILPNNLTLSSPQHKTVSFLSVPSHDGVESKNGILQKKHCYESDFKPVSSGKRSWKNHYVILKGMALYLLKSPKNEIDANSKVILLHHSLAQVARNYRKKSFVFLLRTADWSEYLFSTSSSKELGSWVNEINMMSAEFSAEPLAAGVGSQMKFRRPLFPSSYTKLNLHEQVASHEQKVEQIMLSISEEEKDRPDKSCSKLAISNYNDKLFFLKFELQRYMIYAPLLRVKLEDNSSFGSPSFPVLPERLCEISDRDSITSVDCIGLGPSSSGIANFSRSTTRYSYMQALENSYSPPPCP